MTNRVAGDLRPLGMEIGRTHRAAWHYTQPAPTSEALALRALAERAMERLMRARWAMRSAEFERSLRDVRDSLVRDSRALAAPVLDADGGRELPPPVGFDSPGELRRLGGRPLVTCDDGPTAGWGTYDPDEV